MGIFVLEMTIAPDGHVSQILSHPTYISSKEFQRAVENLAQEWHLDPASTGDVNIFYPLLFMPVEIDPQTVAGLAKEVLPGRYKIIATGPVPVRKGPGDETEELGKASAGLKIEVVSSQGGWLGILSPKGKIGYIRQEAVSSRVGSEGETAS